MSKTISFCIEVQNLEQPTYIILDLRKLNALVFPRWTLHSIPSICFVYGITTFELDTFFFLSVFFLTKSELEANWSDVIHGHWRICLMVFLSNLMQCKFSFCFLQNLVCINMWIYYIHWGVWFNFTIPKGKVRAIIKIKCKTLREKMKHVAVGMQLWHRVIWYKTVTILTINVSKTQPRNCMQISPVC